MERIESVESKLNAFVTELDNQAMESARRADSGLANDTVRPPRHGVPVAIKDQMHMLDLARLRLF